jgi:MYXO-CTERM domain-containing protein
MRYAPLLRRAGLLAVLAMALAHLYACASRRDETSSTPPAPESAAPLAVPLEADLLTRHGDDLVSGPSARPFRLRFSKEWTSLARATDGVRLSLRTAAWGRGDTHAPRVVTRGRAELRGARVEYADDAITEWYERGPRGLEQGFTVSRRPAGAGVLRIDVEVGDGVEIARTTDSAIDLKVRGDATSSFRYSALSTVDASGHTIAAKLSADGATTIRLEIDDRDAVYPITVDPLIWALQSKLVRLQAQAQDSLSSSVAIDGDTVVAGMNGRQDFHGGAQVFRRKGATWGEEDLLDFPDASEHSDFGYWSAIQGDRAVVASDNPAVVFVRTGTTWAPEQVLQANWLLSGGDFGTPVALGPTTIALCVPRKVAEILPDGAVDDGSTQDASAGSPTAAIFLWERTGSVWAPSGEIDLPVPIGLDASGSLALDGDTLVVGTGYYALVYRRAADGSWGLEAALRPETGPTISFAFGVALSGDTLIATSPNDASAYFFKRSGSQWTLVQRTTEPSPSPISFFGSTVALRGDVAFIGDYQRNVAGAVFRYRRVLDTWSLQEEIVPADVTTVSAFGFGIATTADTAVFSAEGQGTFRGAAYVYALRSALGDPCEKADSCASDFCVDGVCCDGACGGGATTDCLACNGVRTRGTCAPAEVSSVCRPAANECDVAESCDGTSTKCGADTVRANGTACGAGTCVAGTCAIEAKDAAVAADASPPSAPPAAIAGAGGCSVAIPAGTSDASSGGPTVGFAAIVFGALLVARRRRVWLALFVLPLAVVVGDVHPLREGGTTIELPSASGDLRATFSSAGATFFEEFHGTSLRFTGIGFGRRDRVETLPASDPESGGGRVSYRRGPLVEWYAADPRGFEQGFDIAARPSGDEPLVIRLALAPEARARRSGDVLTVDLGDALARFGYGELVARDAGGALLKSDMSVVDDGIQLTIDDTSARYPIVVDPLVWRERQKLGAMTPQRLSSFGRSVAVADTHLVVGAPGAQGGNVDVYARTGNTWIHEAALLPSGTLVPIAMFGQAVAMSGNTIVSGAPYAAIPDPLHPGFFTAIGAAFVFERVSAGVWVESAKLQLPDGAFADQFGSAVAIDGDTIAVSALGRHGYDENFNYIGAVFVFTRGVDGAWTQRAELDGSPEARFFGNAVALSGDTIVIGAASAVFHESNVPNAAYFFVGSGGTWTTQYVAPDPGVTFFGDGVAIDGDTAVVSAPLPTTREPAAGSVYVLTRSSGAWSLGPRLRPTDSAVYDYFGNPVIHGSRLAIGAHGANGARGSAYLFERSATGTWAETQRFVASDAAVDDQFGQSVDFTSDMLLVGAPGHKTGTGAVYSFYLGREAEPCTTADQCASGFCVDGICCDTTCGGGNPNDCMACSVAAGAAKDGTCSAASPRVCRAAHDECDVADSCDGIDTTCPADVVAQNWLSCQRGAGACASGRCVATVGLTAVDAGAPRDDGPPPPEAPSSACSCRATGASTANSPYALVALVLAVGAVLSRRRPR